MRTVLAMTVKDLRLMGRDWLGLFFIVGFPILMAVFFGAMYGSFDTGSASLRVAVVDEDESDMSRRFVESLTKSGNVEVKQLGRDEAVNRVRRGQLVGMIAVPRGFGESAGVPGLEGPAIQVGVDPARKAEAGLLEGLIMRSAGTLMIDRFQDPAAMRSLVRAARDELAQADDVSPDLKPLLLDMMDSLDVFMESWQRVERTEAEAGSNGEAAGDMPGFQLARIEAIDVTRQFAKDSTEALVRKLRSKWDISFPQAMIWGILACAAGFAISIVRERKQGTLLRLKVAPVTRAQVLAGKAMACFVAVMAVIALMVALGTWLGMRPQSPGLLAISAACIAFCFVGIMMLMSVIGRSEEAVSGAAWGANMLMAMFGGGMVPLVFMPSFMKTLSDFSPAKWSVLALEGSIWRGLTFGELLLPLAVLIAVGSVCLTIGTLVLSRATD